MAEFHLSRHFQARHFCFQYLKSVDLQQDTSEQGYSPDSSTPGQKCLRVRLRLLSWEWEEGTGEMTQTKTLLNPANWKVLERNVAIPVTTTLAVAVPWDLPNNSPMRFILYEFYSSGRSD